MNKLNKKAILKSLSLLLILPILTGWKVYKTSTGKVLHWTISTVKMVGDVRGTKDVPGNKEWNAVIASMGTWNRVKCNQPKLEFKGLQKDVQIGYWPDRDDNYNGIKWTNSKQEWTQRYGDAFGDVIAFTTVNYNELTGVILDADMDINDWNFFFTVSDNPEDTVFDVQNTVTHELGHVLGMDHSLDGTATMYYSAQEQDLNKRTLEQDDIDGLCYIYKKQHKEPDISNEGVTDIKEEIEPTLPKDPKKGSSIGCTENFNNSNKIGILLITIALIILLRGWRVTQGE